MKARETVVLGLLAALPSLACAPVPGAGRFVHIAAEEAIIVWDEAAKRQHFIRRAAFDTDAKDFGFLVPTPSKPELAEADDEAFRMLARITADPRLEKLNLAATKAEAPAAVTVLEQKAVAGFDAAVLQATDANALDGWLRQHGYPASAELLEWYKPYVAQGWLITAFKVTGATTKPVRMSFQTERAFFPYREPAAKPGAGKPRTLRVYLLAHARYDGTLGEKGAWPGRVVWSGGIEEKQRAQLLKLAGLPSMAGGGGLWLTEFVDRSSPRPGGDEVWFASGTEQAQLKPPPEPEPATDLRRILFAALVLALALLLGGLHYYYRKRS